MEEGGSELRTGFPIGPLQEAYVLTEGSFPYSAEFKRQIVEYFRDLNNPVFEPGRIVASETAAVSSKLLYPISILSHYDGNVAGKELLEAGCGTGSTLVAAALSGIGAHGIDVRSQALDVAKRRGKEHGVDVELSLGDTRSLGYPSSRFDHVVSIQVLEHLRSREDQMRAIGELFRVTKPEGLILIQTPNRSSLIDIHDSKLPVAHRLPSRLGSAYARLFSRPPPACLPMSWKEVAHAFRECGPHEVLNHCALWRDGEDFRSHAFNYVEGVSKDLGAVYLRMVDFVARIFNRCPIVELNSVLPNVDMIVRKQ